MSENTAVMWRGFGRVWQGKTTGNVSPDGYTEVDLAVGSTEWGPQGDGMGWVLSSILQKQE